MLGWLTASNAKCTQRNDLISFHTKSPILCMVCYFITQILNNVFIKRNQKMDVNGSFLMLSQWAFSRTLDGGLCICWLQVQPSCHLLGHSRVFGASNLFASTTVHHCYTNLYSLTPFHLVCSRLDTRTCSWSGCYDMPREGHTGCPLHCYLYIHSYLKHNE